MSAERNCWKCHIFGKEAFFRSRRYRNAFEQTCKKPPDNRFENNNFVFDRNRFGARIRISAVYVGFLFNPLRSYQAKVIMQRSVSYFMQQFGASLEYTLRKTYHARTLPAVPEGTDAAVFLLFALYRTPRIQQA